MMNKTAVVLIFLCSSFTSLAHDHLSKPDDASQRFFAYGQNYIIAQNTKYDDNSFEARYSIGYRFFDYCARYSEPLKEDSMSDRLMSFLTCRDGFNGQLYIDFTYTGVFDFYYPTRESSPVINRLSNPALRLNWNLSEKSEHLRAVVFSVEHRSNGQVVELDSPEERSRAIEAYEKSDQEYFDKLGREANYLKLEAQWGFKYLGLGVSAKAYSATPAEVTWGPEATRSTSFADFDVVNIAIEGSSSQFRESYFGINQLWYRLEYRFGERGLAGDSVNLLLSMPSNFKKQAWTIPWFVRLHFGPMDTLANYTKSTRSIGLGFLFARW